MFRRLVFQSDGRAAERKDGPAAWKPDEQPENIHVMPPVPKGRGITKNKWIKNRINNVQQKTNIGIITVRYPSNLLIMFTLGV